MRIHSILSLTLLLGACATTGERDPNETSVPFVSSTGVLDWRAAGEDSLYVRSASNDWYLVRTMGPCSRLRTAVTLGFVTSGLDQLDRHGAILAEGQRCSVRSVVRSGPPPEESRG